MHKYKELKVWQKAMQLTTDTYKVTARLPDKERFNLISQINRAAVSIQSNIAEGAGRDFNKEFLHFLSIAHASSYELETQIILSNRLGYINETDTYELLKQIEEYQKMSYALPAKLRSI